MPVICLLVCESQLPNEKIGIIIISISQVYVFFPFNDYRRKISIFYFSYLPWEAWYTFTVPNYWL